MKLTELIETQRKIDREYFTGLRETTLKEYWCVAFGGEIGELQNIIKKINRQHQADAEKNQLIEKIYGECSDILIYAMIISDIYDIDITQYNNTRIRFVSDQFSIERKLLEYGTLIGIESGKFQEMIYYNTYQRKHQELKQRLLKITKILYIIAQKLEFNLLEHTYQKQLQNIKRFGNAE